MATVTAPTNVDGTSAAAMLKRIYDKRPPHQIWKHRWPLLSDIKKSDIFVGSQLQVPIEHDHPYVSQNFTQAQTNRYATSTEVFSVTSSDIYGVGRIDAKTMRQAKNDMGAFVRLLDREMQNVMAAVTKRLALGLYRDDGGSLGVVSGSASTGDDGYITLSRKTDVFNFAVGQTLVFANDSDGGTPRSTTGTDDWQVLKLDFTNGRVYLDNIDASTNIADGDYVFVKGDDKTAYQASFTGLAAWCPDSAPSGGESFFGVDRSTSAERLAGHRITDTSLTFEEALHEMCYRIMYTGGNPANAYCSPIQMKRLAQELGSQVVRDPAGTGQTGFSGFNIITANGNLTLKADPACPEDRCYLVGDGAFEYGSLDATVHLVQDDGLRTMRVSDADQLEFRVRAWGNCFSRKPGHLGVIQLPTVL